MRRQPGPAPLSLLLALAAALALAGCDMLPGRPRPTEHQVLPAMVTDFPTLYGRHCAGCHGAEGRLGPARALNDPVYLALAPPERLRAVIAEGVRGTSQPAFAASAGGTLTDAQIDALARGLVDRWGRPDAVRGLSPPPYAGRPGDRERGAAVFAAACASCHGADGTGGEKGGDVVSPTYLALVSDQALRTAVIAGRPDLGMPDWREQVPGRALTPEEVADVVAWLIAKRGPVPGRLDDEPARPRP
jgi:mono/diheme cytochrome c family protein